MFVESPKTSLFSIGALNQAVAEQQPKNEQEILEDELDNTNQQSNFQTIFEQLFGKKNESKTDSDFNDKIFNFKQDKSEKENEISNLIEQNQIANFVVNNPIVNQINNNNYIEKNEHNCAENNGVLKNEKLFSNNNVTKQLGEYNFFPLAYNKDIKINPNITKDDVNFYNLEKDFSKILNNNLSNNKDNLNYIKEVDGLGSVSLGDLNRLTENKNTIGIEKLFSNINIEAPLINSSEIKNDLKTNNHFKNNIYNEDFYNNIVPITDKYFAYPIKNIDINNEFQIDYVVFSESPKDDIKNPTVVGFLAKTKELDFDKQNLLIDLGNDKYNFNKKTNNNFISELLPKNEDRKIVIINKNQDQLDFNIKDFQSNINFPFKNNKINKEFDFNSKEIKFSNLLVNLDNKLLKDNKTEVENKAFSATVLNKPENFSELFIENENLDNKINEKIDNKINDIVNKFNFNNKNNNDMFSNNSDKNEKFFEKFKETEYIEVSKTPEESNGINTIEKGMTAQFSKPVVVSDKSTADFSNPIVSTTMRRAIDVSNQLQVRGGGTAKIQIQDDKIGSVELTINMKRDKSVSMEIKASDIDLKNNLEENAETLKKSLESQEINLIELKVTNLEKSIHAGMNGSANQSFSNQNSQSQQQANDGNNQNSSQQNFNQSLFSGNFSNNNSNFFQNNVESEYLFNKGGNKNYINKNNLKNNMEKNSITNIQRGANGSIKVLA